MNKQLLIYYYTYLCASEFKTDIFFNRCDNNFLSFHYLYVFCLVVITLNTYQLFQSQ